MKLKTDEFAPTGTDPEGEAGITSVGDLLRREHVLGRRAHRACRGAARPCYLHGGSPARRGCGERSADTVEPSGVTAEFNGDAEFPPIEQGNPGSAGPTAALVVLLSSSGRWWRFVAIPIALAIVAVATAPVPAHRRRIHRRHRDHAVVSCRRSGSASGSTTRSSSSRALPATTHEQLTGGSQLQRLALRQGAQRCSPG